MDLAARVGAIEHLVRKVASVIPTRSALPHARPIPMFTAVASALLILGTWVGQSGHAKGEAYASSEAQPGSMANMPGLANMPGMVMPGRPGDDEKRAPNPQPMPGTDTGTSVIGSATAVADSMPGMKVDQTDPMAGMSMSTKNMAAMMPGGYHLTCTAAACTLIVSDRAASAVAVLGLHVKFAKLEAGAITLRVKGKAITIKQGQSVRTGGVTIRAENVQAHESTLRLSKKN